MIALTTLITTIFGFSKIYVATEENSPVYSSSTFICVDGTEMPLANICDGIPHCPDSSDEVGTLCRHVVCPTYMYRCNYGACVSRTARCNGLTDCVDASDEISCDRDANEACSDKDFQCSATVYQECIPFAEVCNGYKDCSDGSDENATICRENICPENTFRCSYGGCVHQEVVCDGVKDCIDGTDEGSNTCTAADCEDEECLQFKCRDEFACENGRRCLPMAKTCDGIRHCADASDENEKLCKTRECPENWFRCAYGGCIRSELKCNSRLNCHDWSDENESLCGVMLPEGACRLPPAKPGTHYSVSGCSRCRPGEIVPELTRLDYTCDVEGSLQGSDKIYCQNNQWFPSIPSCIFENETKAITCPAPSEAHDAIRQCEAMWGPHKGWLSCDQALPVGTRIFLECPAFYERHKGSSSVMCLHDGTWSQSLLSCTPVCGIRDTTEVALIVKGWNVVKEETLPWQATLFSHEDGQWRFFCGGTLITERVVLTAGHCVWKTSADTIRVAFGILSSDLNQVGENAQVIDVKSIELQSAYQDHESNYGSDIALLILRKAVTVNSVVAPACVPWHSDAVLLESQRNGGLGLVGGMGLTENDTFSSVLRMTTMKIISDDECRQNQKRDFRKYLTYTSFCAGWANGTGVCNGDSGGGLVLQRPNSSAWEVHGVVSVSPRKLGTNMCDPNFYAIFTKVSVYTKWIYQVIESIPIIGLPDFDRQPNRDNIVV